MKYEYGDPGNPNCTLHGLNLSCRFTRGKGLATVEVAPDQESRAIEHIDQMIAWLIMTRDALIVGGEKPLKAATFDDAVAEVRQRQREAYRQFMGDGA